MNLFGLKKLVPDVNPVENEPVFNQSVSSATSTRSETPISVDETTGSISDSTKNEEVGPVIEEKPSDFPINIPYPQDISQDPVAELVNLEAESRFETVEPPRALFAGSFLGGQYEIKEVIARGPINFYLADAGDYGTHDWKLVGERIFPIVAANSTKNEGNLETVNGDSTKNEAILPTAEIESVTEGEATKNEAKSGPDDSFFPPAERFLQDGREYAVWDFQILTSLEEWNAQPNDEIYIRVMQTLARAFAALESANLSADLPPSSLFFDAMGELKAFGFFNAPESKSASMPTHSMSATQQLSALSSRFAKTNLAARATLRLDDEFGALPFSLEVKSFARALNDGEFAGAADVLAALESFAPFSKTEVALLSDIGMERELNEDCGWIWKSSRAGHARNHSLEVLAVADGMGGHEGGEVASDVTLSALEAAIAMRLNLDFSDNAVLLLAMSEILSEVNEAVVRLTENPPYAAMRAKPGATLVCALRVENRVFLGNVGDSRAYRWNAKSGLQRLTKDHSYVQDLLDSGSISEAQAWGHPDGSVITSHIGMMRGLKKDVYLHLLSAGDRLVLVSDGVVDTMRDAEIEAVLASAHDAETLCAALVNAANDAGGFDNITVAAMICKS